MYRFDYGEKFWIIKWKQFTCACGSPKCKYSKETIHTTIADFERRQREEDVMDVVVPWWRTLHGYVVNIPSHSKCLMIEIVEGSRMCFSCAAFCCCKRSQTCSRILRQAIPTNAPQQQSICDKTVTHVNTWWISRKSSWRIQMWFHVHLFLENLMELVLFCERWQSTFVWLLWSIHTCFVKAKALR